MSHQAQERREEWKQGFRPPIEVAGIRQIHPGREGHRVPSTTSHGSPTFRKPGQGNQRERAGTKSVMVCHESQQGGESSRK